MLALYPFGFLDLAMLPVKVMLAALLGRHRLASIIVAITAMVVQMCVYPGTVRMETGRFVIEIGDDVVICGNRWLVCVRVMDWQR